MENPLRILHVEDSPKDSELVEATLQQEGIACDVLRVQTRSDFVSALEQSRFDLILGDYTMPGFDGLSALKIAQEKCPDVPFIFVSGTLGEDVAIEALKHGAIDYVLKDRLSRLVTCVRRALREVEEQGERKRAQEALRESEARKKAMLEGALDCIIAIDHQGKVLEFNPAAEKTFGYSLDQVMGKPLADLIIPSHLRERHKQGLKQYIATGEGPFIGKAVEVTAMRVDGTEFPAELAITSIGQKWPPMFLGHLRDITEHKRAEEKMRLQSAALESAANAVVITDRDGIITWVNPAFTKLTGYSPEEAIGQNPRLLKSGTQDQPFYENLWNTIRSGQVWSGEIVNRRKDGVLYSEEQTITPVRDAQGDIIHFIAIKQNITKRKRAEEDIRTLNEELEQRVVERTAELEAANKELEAFSYSVSHDLRAPLRAIDGFSRILLEDYLLQMPPDAQRHLQVVCANTRQMGELIDDLLAFSRLSRQPLRKQPVVLGNLINQVLEDLRAGQQEKSLETTVGNLPDCEGDPALLKQVFVNLLSNAVKFTRKREAPRIEVGWHQREAECVYFVKDNGAGFDMRYADKLFGVFQRLHRAEEYEGTGVGLAIVQRVIHRHGGKVWAESGIDQGATFYFTLKGGHSDG